MFASLVTDETLRLEREGYGTIRLDRGGARRSPSTASSRLASLEIMRTAMLHEVKPVAAFFVGGMQEGINPRIRARPDTCCLGPQSSVLLGPEEMPPASRRWRPAQVLAESLRTSRLYPARR